MQSSMTVTDALKTDAETPSRTYNTSFGNGTGSGKGQICLFQQYPVSGSGSTTINLSAVAGAMGATLNFSKVRAISVEVLGQTTGNKVTVGNAASNSFQGPLSAGATIDSQAQPVDPGVPGVLLMAGVDGWAVTSGNCNLKIANPGSGALNVNVYVVGEGTLG
jgi:hypothetical protein